MAENLEFLEAVHNLNAQADTAMSMLERIVMNPALPTMEALMFAQMLFVIKEQKELNVLMVEENQQLQDRLAEYVQKHLNE